jgi:hypothetical protein
MTLVRTQELLDAAVNARLGVAAFYMFVFVTDARSSW